MTRSRSIDLPPRVLSPTSALRRRSRTEVERRHAARLCRHGGRSDPRGVPALLRGARAQARPVLVADPPARVRPAAHERRHEPVHPVLPRARPGAVPAGRDRPEGLPGGRHRPRRAHRAAPVDVRDARELLVRRLLQGRVVPLGLRARHRGLRDRARPALGHRVPDRRRGDRDLARHRDPRRADRPPRRGRTTSGGRTRPAPPDRVRRSTSTADPSTGPRADPRSTRSATSRSGTTCSCRTRSTITCGSCASSPARTSTRAPAWSAWPSSCRTWTTRSRPTCCGRSSRSPSRSRDGGWGRTSATTSRSR